VPKLSINFEEILYCVYENFEDQIKVLESSTIIIINYSIIIINNAYYMLRNCSGVDSASNRNECQGCFLE